MYGWRGAEKRASAACCSTIWPAYMTTTRRAVSDLTAEGVACVGLGIGSGTREMRSLFGSGLFGVPVERVARSLALIIRQALGVSDAPAGKRAARG